MYRDTADELTRWADARRRREHLDRILARVEETLARQEEELAAREEVLAREERDVERLEGRTIHALVAHLVGGKAEVIDRERGEAVQAMARVDAQREMVAQTRARRAEIERERQALGDVDRGYAEAFEAKARALARAGGAVADTMVETSRRIVEARARARELGEAEWAATRAEHHLRAAADALAGAQGWGTLDLLGGGFVTSVAKHGKMQEANRVFHHARVWVQRLRHEVDDVAAELELGDLVDLVHFTDVFVDNFFSDLLVHQRIQASVQTVHRLRQRVRRIRGRLHESRARTQSELGALDSQLRELVRFA